VIEFGVNWLIFMVTLGLALWPAERIARRRGERLVLHSSRGEFTVVGFVALSQAVVATLFRGVLMALGPAVSAFILVLLPLVTYWARQREGGSRAGAIALAAIQFIALLLIAIIAALAGLEPA